MQFCDIHDDNIALSIYVRLFMCEASIQYSHHEFNSMLRN